jgi:hypothetical protein
MGIDEQPNVGAAGTDPAALRSRPLDEVRAQRDECQQIEDALSFVRRMVQGRIDIVGHEIARRRAGVDEQDLAGLIEALPEIFSESGPRGARRGGSLAVTMSIDSDEDAARAIAELDEIASTAELCSLATLGDERVTELSDQLGAFERRISDRRRAMHDQIDELQSEITRRYRDGEVTVDSLLG